MTGCTAGYDVSSCATAVWHIARLGPRILSWVKNYDGLVFTQEIIFLSLLLLIIVTSLPPSHREFCQSVRKAVTAQFATLKTTRLHNGNLGSLLI